jgi:uncharacterized metal-binding protein YceD (DUF177 family)
MKQDFGHRLPLDRVRGGERIDLVAGQDERQAIAKRLGLASLDRLEAHVAVEREGSRIRAEGRIRAALDLSCVATGEPVAQAVDEPFEIVFLPEPQSPGDEIELSPEDCDVVFYDGAAIDLGSAIADTLALVIDPFPRSASAEAALREAKVLSEDEAGPFAALAKLKRADKES